MIVDGIFRRPACPNDAELMLKWRNQPDVLEFQRTPRTIMRGEHSEWFLDRIKKSANEPFMVYVQNNDIVAFVRFAAIEQRNYEVSVILNPIFRGKRFSKTLLLDAIDYLSRNNSAEEVVATIHRDNQPSIALFSSLGFSTTQIIEGNFIQMRKLLSLKEFKN